MYIGSRAGHCLCVKTVNLLHTLSASQEWTRRNPVQIIVKELSYFSEKLQNINTSASFMTLYT